MQIMKHYGTLQSLPFWAIVREKNTFGPLLGHLLSPFMVENGFRCNYNIPNTTSWQPFSPAKKVSRAYKAQCVKGGGVRKMFFSEKTKGLFWLIGSSY